MQARSIVLLSLLFFAAWPTHAGSKEPASAAEVRRLFAAPPRECSSAPLWVWNDDLTDAQILETLRALARQNVKQAFVHPRPGLMTPYLSDEWFRLWKIALAEAERLDMNLWIYDENSYPSGFAGGFVPEAMPESRGRGLAIAETTAAPKWSAETLTVFYVAEGSYRDVSSRVKSGESLPDGRYVAATVVRAPIRPWHGGRFYVDLLYPGVTEKFLAITLDAYKRELGDAFGKRIPGSFTDEPELRPAGGLPWTEDLPQKFEKRWGYSLTAHLPALRAELGDFKKVRHNYFQTLLELFIERWAKPYYDYCERNRLEFTGHYWEHEWPGCASVPDNMALSAWQQRPGIDILMNQYQEDTHAQFGNVRAVKEISSLANQLGRRRTLCEAYGAGGWDLRFEDMKRIGDWMYALGVNTLDQHLSYVTIRGARKRDHPQSFSYHEPWWEAYGISASYFARLSVALSAGEQRNSILVLEPTTTAWMLNDGARTPSPALKELGGTFQKLVVDLEKAQVEFDLGCEDVLANQGAVEGKDLRVGQRRYSTVVVPALTDNLNSKTAQLLAAFVKAGGNLLGCGKPPSRIDGAPSTGAASLKTGWTAVEQSELPALLADKSNVFSITRNPGDRGILYHHRRALADGEIVFLVNSSIEANSAGTIEATAGGVEEWDALTGKSLRPWFERAGTAVKISFDLPPSGSRLLYFPRAKQQAPPRPPSVNWEELPSTEPVGIRRIGPNVLILDYVDVMAGGETRKDTYFYQAGQFAFQRNGQQRNPWDSAVQFRDEIMSRKFAAESGVEVTYRFRIEDKVPVDLAIVVERPDLYTVTCNGTPVVAKPGAWWLDRSFGKIDIAKTARVGDNALVLKASPFTVRHEIEATYLIGSFDLKPVEKGFVVVSESARSLAKWDASGMPFYSQGVSYSRTFQVERAKSQYHVKLGSWYGSVAKVTVNGADAGYVTAPPWTLDVTGLIKPGRNLVEVTVIGTLKNTLGPHHGKPSLGTAWPSMFQKGPEPGPPPGSEYSTVGYGLFEDFKLLEGRR